MTTPITEAANSITEEIDVSSPLEIVSLLEFCDQEIFDGFEKYKSIFDDTILETIHSISGHVHELLKDNGNGIVVFSGCGTSGRLGFIVARSFNELQRKKGRREIFRYLIAGGDKALFTSQEAPEDDPQAGVDALKQISQEADRVLFIGITCGLSAPYVAGQLDYCMNHSNTKFIPVLLGFNPENLARNIAIEKWDKTFLQVVNKLKEFPSGYILNPIVGPEPITGSSRMKSGTATKILLEVICLTGVIKLYDSKTKLTHSELLLCYREVNRSVYQRKSEIATIVQEAGKSLQSGGHIYYVGTDSLALMGLIDASECPPTYGATLDDVRGFVHLGYETLNNTEGDMSSLGSHFRISLDNFCTDIAPTDQDILIVVNSQKQLLVPSRCLSYNCRRILITFEKVSTTDFDQIVCITLPTTSLDALLDQDVKSMSIQLLREIAVKCCLNAISTGAHVLKGKVYKNIMIDVKVSNNKLFHRAVGIMQKFGNLSKEKATDYLLRSIYNTDDVNDEIRNSSVGQHIRTATDKDKVVPVALVAAVTHSSIEDARQRLSRQPVVRNTIVEALENM